MTQSQQKEAMLSELFGDAYKPLNPKEKTSKQEIKNKDIVQRQAVVESDFTPSGLPSYDEIKRILRRNDSKVYDEKSQISEWMAENNPIAVLQVSNPISSNLADDLKENIIPYVSLKDSHSTLFCVRGCDSDRLRRSLENTIFNVTSIPFMFNYETFKRLTDSPPVKTSFITDISEYQMEVIRREIARKGNSNKFTVFRMNDNLWGVGFQDTDFLMSANDSKTKTSFAEAYLYSAILLNGPNKEQNEKRLLADIRADRSASIQCKFALKYNPAIFLYDPTLPLSAIKVTEAGYQKIEISKKKNTYGLKEGAFIPWEDANAEYLFHHELIKMNHKATVYSSHDFATAYEAWAHRDPKLVQKELGTEYLERQLAHQLYVAFAKEHEKEPWFIKGSVDVQAKEFKKEMTSILESFSHKEMSLYHTDEQGRAFFNLMSSVDYDIRPLNNVAVDINKMDLRQIRDNTRDNYLSLREILRNMDVKAPVYKDYDRTYLGV